MIKEYIPEPSGPPQMMHTDGKPALEYEKYIAQTSCDAAEQRPTELESLVDRTKQARKTLLEAIQGIGDAVETFKPQSDIYIKELRAFNSGAVLEFKNSLRAFEDIRKFFLDKSHAEEVARLREFVELCERLKSLKDSGFLDAVADTILKL